MDRAEHPVAVGVKLAAVGLDEAREGVLVAAARRLEQLLLVGASWYGRGHRPQTRHAPASRLIAPAMSFGAAPVLWAMA